MRIKRWPLLNREDILFHRLVVVAPAHQCLFQLLMFVRGLMMKMR